MHPYREMPLLRVLASSPVYHCTWAILIENFCVAALLASCVIKTETQGDKKQEKNTGNIYREHKPQAVRIPSSGNYDVHRFKNKQKNKVSVFFNISRVASGRVGLGQEIFEILRVGSGPVRVKIISILTGVGSDHLDPARPAKSGTTSEKP